MPTIRYRLALDLGATSLGWAVLRLSEGEPPRPSAIIRAGVRIFSDGRNPKDGSSLAVTRRAARAMRRRRDRLLRRKARIIDALVRHGFFPTDIGMRKSLERLDPYVLRAQGLDVALKPEEFGRALFHLNQRRGFKSNRKTDRKDNDSSALKAAIQRSHAIIDPRGTDGRPRTVGEWLHRRHAAGELVRARYREHRVARDDGKTRIEKSYDLYLDRALIEAEFDALWAKQSSLNPVLFCEAARDELKDALLHQRKLRPVRPGRCTLLPDEERGPLALPSTQRFRILQEVNNLRILQEGLTDQPLTLAQRDAVVEALERHPKRSFTQIRKILGLSGTTAFNIEDPKRQELKGNSTSASLAREDHFGAAWYQFDAPEQDAIVLRLLNDEDEPALVKWLAETFRVDLERAARIAGAGLPEGYGSLSAKALERIIPELRKNVVSYAEAARLAGFHHSRLEANDAVPGRTLPVERVDAATGEIKTWHIFQELPYYGEFLQRHVGFADPRALPDDLPEKRFGRIANPTVHIGLNQVRVVVNALIRRYGLPAEIIVEVARDLKQSREQREEEQRRQADNQRRNERLRAEAAGILGVDPHRVSQGDLQKLILWEELSHDVADRRCPYSGVQISKEMLLSPRVEIEHILPFSKTLDDSLNNKTVALREANRIKGNRAPWDARSDFEAQGWTYVDIEARASLMDRRKRYRFAEDGMSKWLREDKDFLARALNDTRYLSRVAREYLSLICPQGTRVIPGQMTALLRGKFGLNDVLGLSGEKNRNDHRHHAVDACVVAVTDQGLLKRFADASADARAQQLGRLVETMPEPWPTYRDHVRRAVQAIWVSHKPDHGHEGAMHNDTAYALRGGGRVSVRKRVDGLRVRDESALKVIEIQGDPARHGTLPDGSPRPYKGYKGDSNYCLEIVRTDNGRWDGHVVSTFEAYQRTRGESSQEGLKRLRHPTLGAQNLPLVMRLTIGDTVRFEMDGALRTMRVASINAAGRLTLADLNESNTDARNRDTNGTWRYTYKQAGSLQKAQGRRVGISPLGEVKDPGPAA